MKQNKKIGKGILLLILLILIFSTFSVSIVYSAEEQGHIRYEYTEKEDLTDACKKEYTRSWESVSLTEKKKEVNEAEKFEKNKTSYKKGARFGGVCNSLFGRKKDKGTDEDYGRFVTSGDPRDSGSREYGYYQDKNENWYYTSKSTEAKIEEGRVVDELSLIDTANKKQVGWDDGGVFYVARGFETIEGEDKTIDGKDYTYVKKCKDTKGRDYEDCHIDARGGIHDDKGNIYERAYLEAASGSGHAEAPFQMQHGVDPNKEYVLDPKSSLTQSFKAVCLPAASAYLTQYRTIADSIRKCVKTIRVTGEGRAGVCQAIISQYVCDFIMDQILCRTTSKKAGKMRHSATRSGNFLSILSGQVDSTQSGISNRYGETNSFKAMFSQRKLVNSMCLGAFSNDWGIDIDAMLSEDYTVPIESEGFVSPATRRFVATNPLDGRVTFMYHIGSALIAGTDLSFELKLMCSNDDSCIGQDYPENHCDCFGMMDPKEKVIATGRLSNGEMFGEDERGDQYVMIESTETPSVRYDKIVLEWRDDNKCKSWGNPECRIVKPIKGIGQRPPMDCKFDRDFSDPPEYKCEYEPSRYGDAWFSQEVLAMNGETRSRTYYLGDTIRLGLTDGDKVYAFKKMPKGKKYPVYYYWKIMNSDNYIVEHEVITLNKEKNELEEPNWEFTKVNALKIGGEKTATRSQNCVIDSSTSYLELTKNYFECKQDFILKYENGDFIAVVDGDNIECEKTGLKVSCGTNGKIAKFELQKEPSSKKFQLSIKLKFVTDETTSLDVSRLCPENRPERWILEVGLYKPLFNEQGKIVTNQKSEDTYKHENVDQKARIGINVHCVENPGGGSADIVFIGKDKYGDDVNLDTDQTGELAYVPMTCSNYIKEIKIKNPDADRVIIDINKTGNDGKTEGVTEEIKGLSGGNEKKIREDQLGELSEAICTVPDYSENNERIDIFVFVFNNIDQQIGQSRFIVKPNYDKRRYETCGKKDEGICTYDRDTKVAEEGRKPQGGKDNEFREQCEKAYSEKEFYKKTFEDKGINCYIKKEGGAIKTEKPGEEEHYCTKDFGEQEFKCESGSLDALKEEGYECKEGKVCNDNKDYCCGSSANLYCCKKTSIFTTEPAVE